VNDTLDDLIKKANFYTRLDLAFGLWQIRVREEDVHKTTFKTLDGVIEWVAMVFGMCNASTTF
jgi:hypothetical protein